MSKLDVEGIFEDHVTWLEHCHSPYAAYLAEEASKMLVSADACKPKSAEEILFSVCGLVVSDPTKVGRLIGFGALYPLAKSQYELGSIVSSPQWRGKGVGSAITSWLVGVYNDDYRQHESGLWLVCDESLEGFYQSFGFVVPETLPEQIAHRKQEADSVSKKLLSLIVD
jgi:N-acetylglutamate synthase-like GNAT family acetyltransferase